MTNPNDPASPADEMYNTDAKNNEPQMFSGLTKREYFAALAMQAFRSCPELTRRIFALAESGALAAKFGTDDAFVAGQAVKQADALIEALNAGDAE